ncbi:MAG: hypothetical protein AB1775_00135 [Bacteroidota bacterium]
MALVESNPLFQINGRVGRYVVKKFNGKRVISLRPVHYKKTKSRVALKLQSNFASVICLAKHINSIQNLVSIWNTSSIKGFSAYHKIIKSNLKITKFGELTAQNIIVPDSIPSLITDMQLSKNELMVSINNLTTLKSFVSSHAATLVTVFVYSNSKRRTKSSLHISSTLHHLKIEDCPVISKNVFLFQTNNPKWEIGFVT